MTNADKIRNMTDDELGNFLKDKLDRCYCCGRDSNPCENENGMNATMCEDILCWLKFELRSDK